jgi:acyl-CoA reductase-like NAD-dependent aldehyde dehydrogenase
MESRDDHLLYVGGRWEPASGGRTRPVVNPATEETAAEVAEASAADVDRAVLAATPLSALLLAEVADEAGLESSARPG